MTMNADKLLSKYRFVRKATENLCLPLKTEDYSIQPISDVSPPKWHLGHTSWFFEMFILKDRLSESALFNKDFPYLFNSYYQNLGDRILRVNRGHLSRPTIDEVYKYRSHVDELMHEVLSSDVDEKILFLTELGLQHEQQHQELLLTDIKYILGNNPLFPAYNENIEIDNSPPPTAEFIDFDEGLHQIGYDGNEFFYDNEKGVHKTFLHAFRIMNRPATNGEFLEFMESGAYKDHNLWLSDAWDWLQQNKVSSPEYWHKIEGKWHYYTLSGLKELDINAPVTHISYYEAEAFARWKNKRLPTEFEWEVACKELSPEVTENSNFQDTGIFSPQSGSGNKMFGDTWEWTGSSYLPYPYYKKDNGALGEYNAKFMIDQMVLRGGSCATPQSHIRPTYRNFFQADKRWQFTGIRLAEHT